MPEVKISVGGREFTVACQEGEQEFLGQAAQLLDGEAALLGDQLGRMPETRMLLMAGLMLADKAAGMDEQMRALEEKAISQQALIDELNASGGGAVASDAAPQASEALAELTAQAEALADIMEGTAGN